MNRQKISGLLLFLAGSIALMGIITAEAMYPPGLGYTTFTNEISDLGATKPPNSLIYQPSSGIFNISMLLSGLLALTATLLRPPQISEVEEYFKPLMEAAIKNGIKYIVFLSVQGADKSKFIPHHTIEKLIVENKIPYTFLRTAYFMINFIQRFAMI